MVYCGKPSRGCQMCRTRRIKCDETKPTCNQCTKSRRQCPGYKDDFDLVFRNETKATERRAQRANKKGLASRVDRKNSSSDETQSTSPPSHDTGTDMVSAWSVASSTTLSSPVEDQASCHFLSHFVLLPRDGRTVGHMEFVLPLLKSQGSDSHVQHAFNACALTFLNNRRGIGGRCWDKALTEYSMALSRTNAALRDPELQQTDATLAAVLMLGMFENIATAQVSTFNWRSHVEGAVQLVKARGKKQIRTKVGLQLFIAVRTLMSVYCLSASKPPEMSADWWLDGTPFSQTAAVVQRLMIRTSEIRGRATELIDSLTRTATSAELMLDLIGKAQAIDQEIVAWQESVPAEWRKTTVAWHDEQEPSLADIFPGRIDTYNDVWLASITNSARAVRLILHTTIVRASAWLCAPADYRTTPEFTTAARVCRDNIADIIASVPYFLGHPATKTANNATTNTTDNTNTTNSSKTNSTANTTNFGTFACGEEHGAKGLAGYLVTWPLTCVISQDHATDAQRAWVVGRLRCIGGELGVKYALAMCQLQVRVPSMLIRRDALLKSHPVAVSLDSASVVAARMAAPSTGYALNPVQQWEAMQQRRIDQGKAELIEQLAGNSPDEGARMVAGRWLKI
ncbi:hypothetical protein F4777DRAFT_182091 [Nemania sp. FL0916]|nr:hypothetical protein F4777DRAFT_182091 [Nemania sp. FL0916]